METFIILSLALLVVGGLVGAARETYAEYALGRQIARTKREEVINGRKYTVVTRPYTVVRQKRTKQLGLLLDQGIETEPTHKNEGVSIQPQWIKIQLIPKKASASHQPQWRRFKDFEIVGVTEVDLLTRRVNFLHSESLVRYLPDQESRREQRIDND